MVSAASSKRPKSIQEQNSALAWGDDESTSSWEQVWEPGKGQIPTCIIDDWDKVYSPEIANRWKNTTYHDDMELLQGYENEYLHANMTLKKFPPTVRKALQFWNKQNPNATVPLLPGQLCYHPLMIPFRMAKYRDPEQLQLELLEEKCMRMERRGLVRTPNRTLERWSMVLFEACDEVMSPMQYTICDTAD